jgi:hypothetical protein
MPARSKQPVVVHYVEHCPPDVAAAFIWLKNRDPERWRDVQNVEHVLGKYRTPDSLPWSVKSLRSALLKRQRRASAIRLACALLDWPLWDTTGKLASPLHALRPATMRDELVIEEMAVRAIQEKMDEAFRAAMQRAIATGEESTPTGVSKKPSTKKPIVVLAF